MTADLDLDPEQREELARLLGGATLGSLLQDWQRFVTAVERGYDDSIYEYTNDLSVRDRLERVVAGASPGPAPSTTRSSRSRTERSFVYS